MGQVHSAAPHRDLKDDQVVQLFQETIGVDVIAVQDSTVGCDHFVKLVRAASEPDFVLKIPRSETNKLTSEVECTRTAFQLGIPSPTVLYVDVKRNVLIETLVKGISLEKFTRFIRTTWSNEIPVQVKERSNVASAVEERLVLIYSEMGKALRKLHINRAAPRGHFREYVCDLSNSTNRVFENALDFYTRNKWAAKHHSTGRYLVDYPNPPSNCARDKEQLVQFNNKLKHTKVNRDERIDFNRRDAYIQSLTKALQTESGIQDEFVEALQDWARSNLSCLENITTPVLCHGDYDDSNVIVSIDAKLSQELEHKKHLDDISQVLSIEPLQVDENPLTGVIDWGDAYWGAPAEDLACMYITHYGYWSWEVFYQAYLDSAPMTVSHNEFFQQVQVYAFLRLTWATNLTPTRQREILQGLCTSHQQR